MVRSCAESTKIRVVYDASAVAYHGALSSMIASVERGQLVSLGNPNYMDLIQSYPHLEGITMNDTDRKARLPIHLILGASEYAKIETNTPAKIGTPGQPITELTRLE